MFEKVSTENNLDFIHVSFDELCFPDFTSSVSFSKDGFQLAKNISQIYIRTMKNLHYQEMWKSEENKMSRKPHLDFGCSKHSSNNVDRNIRNT